MATYKSIAYSPISGGSAMVLLNEQTASTSNDISFTSGIDSTYKEYVFKLINIHPSADGSNIEFQASIDSGSNYNLTITSSCFLAQHSEDDGTANLGYYAARDQAQATTFQDFMTDVGNGNDECGSGYLHLYNPSNTTFIKHFIASALVYYSGDRFFDYKYAGYFNTTSAINAFQFKPASGTIDVGTIKLYGVN